MDQGTPQGESDVIARELADRLAGMEQTLEALASSLSGMAEDHMSPVVFDQIRAALLTLAGVQKSQIDVLEVLVDGR